MATSSAASPLTASTPNPPAELLEDGRFNTLLNKNNPTHFVPNFSSRAQWEARSAALRRQALVSLGLWPLPPRTPMNPVIHGRIDRDGYTIEKVFFASVPGHYVTGNLYRPTGRAGQKLPAILRPYGHWPNGRFIWRSPEDIEKELNLGAERLPDAAKSPQQASCSMLARMGCVVFQFDMIGYCDNKNIPHKEGFLDAQAVLRLQNFMGLQTWNSIRSLDFVLDLPDVDPQRVGITGSSQGGMQSFSLTTLDDRVAAMFLVCSVSMTMQGGCVCGNTPLLRINANNVEFASMFAPKPLGIAAAHDWTQNFEKLGLPEMKSIYRLYGATDQISARTFPYPHNFNVHSREMMYEFFNRQFKLGWPEPVTELPFVPTEPAQLSVFDAKHLQPADATNAVGVRKWMTQTSNEQISHLEKQPKEFAATVRTALVTMIGDELPTSNQIEIIEGGPIRASSWRGYFRRKGTNERIACRALFPSRWDSEMILWSHPLGVASLSDTDPAIHKLLDNHVAIFAADLFMSGSFVPDHELPQMPLPAGKPPTPIDLYIGMRICYERTVIMNRAHDLLSAITLARSTPKLRSLHLAAFGVAGPAALAARALAGNAIERAAIDLNRFDFEQITQDSDPMLLPGALKYGGVAGLDRLCANRPTFLCNTAADSETKTPLQMVDWLLAAR